MRVRKTADDSTITYLWDRESGLPLLVDDGTTGYVHANGVLQQVKESDGTPRYLLGDALGSVRGATDEDGTLTGSVDYDVFGSARGTNTIGSTFGFTGEQTDTETAFSFLRSRYLDPTLGRFLSTDTVQPNAAGTQGYNLYAYVANNPTTWIDPSGHVADLTDPLATVLSSHAYAVALMSPTYGPAIAAATAAALSSARSHWGTIPIAVIGILVVSCWLTECVDYDLPRLRADQVLEQVRPRGHTTASGGPAPEPSHVPRPGQSPAPRPTSPPLPVPAPTSHGDGRDDCTNRRTRGPYSHLPDSLTVAPGKRFTSAQKDRILEENWKRNGQRTTPDGRRILVSDGDGRELIYDSSRPYDPNSPVVDHICPRSRGGSNSYSNAQVLSFEENGRKYNHFP